MFKDHCCTRMAILVGSAYMSTASSAILDFKVRLIVSFTWSEINARYSALGTTNWRTDSIHKYMHSVSDHLLIVNVYFNLIQLTIPNVMQNGC